MYSQFQGSYQRVESSLQKLSDSIAAYNPSVSAADELVAADEAVKQNVDELVKHQQNYHRIQELRATTDSLDETIKTTLRLLADARKDIASIPTFDTAASTPSAQVDIHELLTYAKFIAPTTVPPTYRKPLKDEHTQQSKAPDTTTDNTAQISNGLSTPQAEDPDSNPAFIRSDNLSNLKSAITEEKDLAWLVPNNDNFQPWPTQAVMNSGALGEIQRMVERGEDPALKLSKEEQAEADRKREAEEEERKRKRDEEERRAKEMFGAAAAGQRRGTVVEAFNPDDL
ncbi:putative mediator complex, subunit Med4 [Septoria linicola]|nr:putative mediator complex, subunit Med4 [Septoria linicola]